MFAAESKQLSLQSTHPNGNAGGIVPSESSKVNTISNKRKMNLKRRNSTGTIYVGNTMSLQDNEATIKCVCIVIRAHIIEAKRRNVAPSKMYDIFKESNMSASLSNTIPSLKEIHDFFTLIFSKSQLESECIIMALIYCERMIKATNGNFIIRFDNWKSMYVSLTTCLFVCLLSSGI